MENMYKEIRAYADSQKEELVDFRRDLHKHPEQGWLEIRTTYKLYEELSKLDCKILMGSDVTDQKSKMGVPNQDDLDRAYKYAVENGVPKDFADKVKDSNTGLIAVFENGQGPVVGMRFDIDALPLFETQNTDHYPVKEDFVSANDGSMHACGHDGHATIGLGVAKTINKYKEEFKGTVKLIFQPAEEGVRGAKSIVEKGHLDDVKYFFASHIISNDKYEDYDLFPGAGGSLATTKLNVEFFGKSTHAAGSPEKGNNAMLGLGTSIMNLYAIPRHSGGETRVNVGVANCGTGRNIIADYANFLVETRGSNTEINTYVRNYALNIIEGAAKMHKLEYKTFLAGEANSLESDEELMEIIREVSKELGLKPAPKNRMASGGSEDVSYMISRVQENGGLASFMQVLTPVSASAHNIAYNFDEQVIPKAISSFAGSAYRVMKDK